MTYSVVSLGPAKSVGTAIQRFQPLEICPRPARDAPATRFLMYGSGEQTGKRLRLILDLVIEADIHDNVGAIRRDIDVPGSAQDDPRLSDTFLLRDPLKRIRPFFAPRSLP